MKLPLLLSVPHAGLDVPPEVAPYCRLTRDEIVADGDEGAAEICDPEPLVEAFQTTKVARAFVDPMAPREEVAEKMEDHRLSDQSTGAGHSLG